MEVWIVSHEIKGHCMPVGVYRSLASARAYVRKQWGESEWFSGGETVIVMSIPKRPSERVMIERMEVQD